MKRRLFLVVLVATFMTVLPLLAAESSGSRTQRIVTVGSAVSETVCALGFCERIVGTDDTSLYPASLNDKPRLGFFKKLQAEGVLSLRPSLVLATEDAGPPHALQQIAKAGVMIHVTKPAQSPDSTKELIRAVAHSLGVSAKGEEIVGKIEADLARLREKTVAIATRPKALFIYARGTKVLMVAGSQSSGAEMVALAGAEPTPRSFTGYKPLTAEGVIAADPDVIVMTTEGVASMGGEAGALALPGVALTKAGKNRRIVVMDDLLLLGFGPRLGEAAHLLHDRLFAKAKARG